jgi:hypothetical protein
VPPLAFALQKSNELLCIERTNRFIHFGRLRVCRRKHTTWLEAGRESGIAKLSLTIRSGGRFQAEQFDVDVAIYLQIA